MKVDDSSNQQPQPAVSKTITVTVNVTETLTVTAKVTGTLTEK